MCGLIDMDLHGDWEPLANAQSGVFVKNKQIWQCQTLYELD